MYLPIMGNPKCQPFAHGSYQDVILASFHASVTVANLRFPIPVFAGWIAGSRHHVLQRGLRSIAGLPSGLDAINCVIVGAMSTIISTLAVDGFIGRLIIAKAEVQRVWFHLVALL